MPSSCVLTLECDPGRVLTSGEGTAKYNEDWLGTVRGASSCVLRPRDTREVSSILAHCASRQLAICPQVLITNSSHLSRQPPSLQGGNTGLVGGSVPVFDEVVVSTELMTNIEAIDPGSGVAVCQVLIFMICILSIIFIIIVSSQVWCWRA